MNAAYRAKMAAIAEDESATVAEPVTFSPAGEPIIATDVVVESEVKAERLKAETTPILPATTIAGSVVVGLVAQSQPVISLPIDSAAPPSAGSANAGLVDGVPKKQMQHPGKLYGCSCGLWFSRKGYWQTHARYVVQNGIVHNLESEPVPGVVVTSRERAQRARHKDRERKAQQVDETVTVVMDKKPRKPYQSNGNHPEYTRKNPTPHTRICTLCKKELPVEDFKLKYPSKSQTLRWAYCEPCRAEYQKRHYLHSGQVAIDAEILSALLAQITKDGTNPMEMDTVEEEPTKAPTPQATADKSPPTYLATTSAGAIIIEMDGVLYLARRLVEA